MALFRPTKHLQRKYIYGYISTKEKRKQVSTPWSIKHTNTHTRTTSKIQMKSGQNHSSNPFVDPEKTLLCDISYLKDIFPDPQYSFSLLRLLSMMMLHPKRLLKLFLADNLHDIGAKKSPAYVAISAPEKQTIGFISLRLAPPVKIRRLQDVRDVFLNHEFLRLLMLVAWLVLCGFIETFMAQLSDMRYHAGPAISKVFTKEREREGKRTGTNINVYFTLFSTPCVISCTMHFLSLQTHK